MRLLGLLLPLALGAQVREYITADTYTRYELLAPETNSFKILYEVTETRAGAKYHFNIIRPGSAASDEAALDRASGKPLEFQEVSGKEARSDPGGENLREDARYIRVRLAQPVPQGGEARLLIIKTYKDAASYFTKDGLIVFARSLGIPKNAIVLPTGYELVSLNIPSQIATEPDGRLRISFINDQPTPADLRLTARRLPQ
jgi:hypothetical protein